MDLETVHLKIHGREATLCSHTFNRIPGTVAGLLGPFILNIPVIGSHYANADGWVCSVEESNSKPSKTNRKIHEQSLPLPIFFCFLCNRSQGKWRDGGRPPRRQLGRGTHGLGRPVGAMPRDPRPAPLPSRDARCPPAAGSARAPAQPPGVSGCPEPYGFAPREHRLQGKQTNPKLR